MGAIVIFSLLAAYKVLLQILALFMAFHTRRIKVKGLNDSKEIFAIVYINTIVLAVVLTLLVALEGLHYAATIVNGLGLFILATLFQGLLFVPKGKEM